MSTPAFNFNATPTLQNQAGLDAFIRTTRIVPRTVFNDTIEEIRKCLIYELDVDEVIAELRGDEVLIPLINRTVGCFADHSSFYAEMTAPTGLATYQAYMRSWLGAELYWRYPAHFDRLPAAFKGE